MLRESPEYEYPLEEEGVQKASAKASSGQGDLGQLHTAQTLQLFSQKPLLRVKSRNSQYPTGPSS